MSVVRLAFDDRHVDPILDEQKTLTFRYDLDRDEIEPGDQLIMLTAETREVFARASVDVVGTASAHWLARRDLVGHQSYRDVGELLDELRRYYPDATLQLATELTYVEWTAVVQADGFQRGPVREDPRPDYGTPDDPARVPPRGDRS